MADPLNWRHRNQSRIWGLEMFKTSVKQYSSRELWLVKNHRISKMQHKLVHMVWQVIIRKQASTALWAAPAIPGNMRGSLARMACKLWYKVMDSLRHQLRIQQIRMAIPKHQIQMSTYIQTMDRFWLAPRVTKRATLVPVWDRTLCKSRLFIRHRNNGVWQLQLNLEQLSHLTPVALPLQVLDWM